MSSAHLLIISDIHLGEYSKEVKRIDYLKEFSRSDEDLCAFLEFHQARWTDNTPWRLIINGDFIDFIAVTFRPHDTNPDAPELRDHEHAWGLDSSPEKAVWKLERIVDRHQRFFTYLADFIGHGNSVEILHGNHDAEFWWPEVHDAMRRLLRTIYFGGEHHPDADPDAFEKRIVFHPWFLYEPGKFFIEHGNQYDDFSSFKHRLNPVDPQDPANLAMPISHMAIRYFVNQYNGFRSHNKDNWTVLDYLRWLRAQGTDNLRHILHLSATLSKEMLTYALRSHIHDDSPARAIHLRRLQDIATQYDLTTSQIERLDALSKPPVTDSIGKTLQTVGVDRAFHVLFWLTIAFIVWVIPFSWTNTALLFAAILLGAVLSSFLWPYVREHALGGQINTSVAPKVDRAAHELARIFQARYIIFGHTHKPRKTRLSASSWYLNSGSWLAPRRRERHSVVHGTEVCPSRLTFIVHRDGPTPDARLFRWCSRNATPIPFDPNAGLEDLDPEQVTLHTH